MGAERPPYGTRQRKFSPLSAHVSMSPVSRDEPSRLGPRNSGQSPPGTRRGPWAVTESDTASRAAVQRQTFFTMATNIRLSRPIVFTVPARHNCAHASLFDRGFHTAD